MEQNSSRSLPRRRSANSLGRALTNFRVYIPERTASHLETGIFGAQRALTFLGRSYLTYSTNRVRLIQASYSGKDAWAEKYLS
jgi:hypothetical protein